MSRSFFRMLVGAAILAVTPAVAQAQQLSCFKAGATPSSPNCSVTSALTLEAVAAMNITAPGSPNFDVSGLSAANWNTILNGGSLRVQPSGGTNWWTVAVAANDTFVVNVSGAVTGDAGRDEGDYEYEFRTTSETCSGSGSVIPTSATQVAAAALPTVAGTATRRLCLYAVLDGGQPTTIAPGTYTLTVTLQLTAP